jgi:hypothetical protein
MVSPPTANELPDAARTVAGANVSLIAGTTVDVVGSPRVPEDNPLATSPPIASENTGEVAVVPVPGEMIDSLMLSVDPVESISVASICWLAPVVPSDSSPNSVVPSSSLISSTVAVLEDRDPSWNTVVEEDCSSDSLTLLEIESLRSELTDSLNT